MPILIAVNFHYIRESFDYPYPGIHGITPAQFEQQMRILSGAGQWISAAQLRDAALNRAALPEHALMVTFDDGFREHYECAWQILKRLNIPAVFYINTQPTQQGVVSMVHKIHLLRAHIAPAKFVEQLERMAGARGITLTFDQRLLSEVRTQYRYDQPEVAKLKYLLNLGLEPALRDALLDELFAATFPGAEREMSRQLYLSREQIKEMADAGVIGNHSHEHLPLGLIPLEEAHRQLQMNSDLLEEWTGHRPFTFSYPYGSRSATSPEVGRIAAQSGYAFGFTMERGANVDLSEPVHLARFDTNDLPGGREARWTLADLWDKTPRRSWYGSGATSSR